MKNKIEKYFHSRFPSLRKKELNKVDLTEFVDSLSIFDLVYYLEKNFKIKIKQDEVLFKNFSSISSIEKLLKKKIKGE